MRNTITTDICRPQVFRTPPGNEMRLSPEKLVNQKSRESDYTIFQLDSERMNILQRKVDQRFRALRYVSVWRGKTSFAQVSAARE